MATTKVGAAPRADEPHACRARYEFRALAAMCRLAMDRDLHPRAAIPLLVEQGVCTHPGSLAVTLGHAEREARAFAFRTTRTVADDADRAVLRSQLGLVR